MNSVKYRQFDSPAYYHIYNRGAGKQKIFLDTTDKKKFISLMARYLDPNVKEYRADGVEYEKIDAEITAYCLMGNHFHVLAYQENDPHAIRDLINSVSIAYSMYFNKRHKRSGRLFEGPFRAVQITNETYLRHITRYIHMNPRTYLTYKWSSLPEYLNKRQTTWVKPERLLDMSPSQYLQFLQDYESQKASLEEIKNQLNL